MTSVNCVACLATVTALALSGCPDLCKSRSPAAELTVTLAGSLSGHAGLITALDVTVQSSAFGARDAGSRRVQFTVSKQLVIGPATFTVQPPNQGDFQMHVTADAREGKIVVGHGEDDYRASGDACNFFTLELRPTVPLVDGRSDETIREGGVDKAADLKIVPDLKSDILPYDLQSPHGCTQSGVEFEATQPLTPGALVQVFVGTNNAAYVNWVSVGVARVSSKDCGTGYVQPAQSNVQHGTWTYAHQWRFENVAVPASPPYFFSWLYDATSNDCKAPAAKVISCLAK
jgi:hypothetical protein